MQSCQMEHAVRESRSFLRVFRLLFVLSFCLVGVGCLLQPISLIGFPCTSEGECPAGEICRNGKCISVYDAIACDNNRECEACLETCNEQGICEQIECSNDSQCACKGWVCDLKTKRCREQTVVSECKTDKECKFGICDSGRCKIQCSEDKECSNTNRCDLGRCTPCKQPDDCTSGRCSNGKCVPCQGDSECKSRLCRDGSCTDCRNNNDCATGFCKDGVCENCNSNQDCPSLFCRSSDRTCQPCASKEDCESKKCEKGRCSAPCQSSTDCSSRLCVGGECRACTKADDCPFLNCVNGNCLGPCSSNADCLNGRVCSFQKCTLPGEGASCSVELGCYESLICVGEGGGQVCRKGCNPLQTGECPSGQLCSLLATPGATEGICKPELSTGGKVGSACSEQTPCQVDLVCRQEAAGGVCRQVCDLGVEEKCPTTLECLRRDPQQLSQVGLCLPPTCENKPESCTGDTMCYHGSCRKTCDATQPKVGCPATQFCFGIDANNAKKGVCKDKECGYPGKYCLIKAYCLDFQCKPVPAKKACQQSSECGTNTCVQFSAGATGGASEAFCLKKCKLSDTSACKAEVGHVCTPFGSDFSQSVCVPKIGGGVTGDKCDTTVRCEWTHVCILSNEESYCLRGCDPNSTKKTCPTTYGCFALRSSPKRGVCAKDKVVSSNSRCGANFGVCGSDYGCIADGKSKPSYCRRECTSSCGSGFRCTTPRGKSRKYCMPR